MVTAHNPVDTRMKAIVHTRPGDSSVLELVERDMPQPGPGEVRVQLKVSGVNPVGKVLIDV